MLKNFFKSTIRNLWRRRGFSAINILGLAIGMAAAILILLWVQNERSTDRFYSKTDRIYLLHNRYKAAGEWQIWDNTPNLLAPTLKHDYAGVEDAARYRIVYFLMSSGDNHLQPRGAFADSSFLKLFDLSFLKGNAASALKGNKDIVLTQNLATRLFGKEDPMGKTVRIDSADNFVVTGVLKNLPANTNFDFEFLLPWSYTDKLGWFDNSWEQNPATTYVLLKSGVSQASFDTQVQNITIKHSRATPQVFSQAMGRTWLYSKEENGRLTAGRIEIVQLFIVIAVFILLIACINFMNLSTARGSQRAKEVGVRKVIGAGKGSLIAQFIGESILLSFSAFVVAALLVQVSLGGFNELVGRELSVDYGSPSLWLFAGGFILFTGILAGSYPAFYLSSFNPSKVLKGTLGNIRSLATPRKVLVVLQFSFALILIVSTLVVERQIKYAQERNAGYDRSNMIFTFVQGEAPRNYQLIKHDLFSSGAAVAITRSANPITRRWGRETDFIWQGSTEADKKTLFVPMGSDADFVKTMGATLLQGRDIDIYHYPTDSTALLLNESAVKSMRLKDPIGQIVQQAGNRSWHVVGVVKDFILESPYETRINPMMIMGPTYPFQVMHIKLNPAHTTADNLASMGKIFRKYNPEYPFDYVFVDEAYAQKFENEQRTSELAALFAGLTIFISCLGLFGLATYMAESRTKEIGVRKVLGASVSSITALLSREFIVLVLISILVASPIAFFSMDHWLQGFSYRITISWWLFLLAGLLAIGIALLTVSYQAIRAARANPVKSLRAE